MLVLSWLLATAAMPLAMGAAIGALGARVLRPCGAGWRRLALLAAASACVLQFALVGSGAVRDGSVLDYALVLLTAVAAAALGCRRG